MPYIHTRILYVHRDTLKARTHTHAHTHIHTHTYTHTHTHTQGLIAYPKRKPGSGGRGKEAKVFFYTLYLIY